MTLYGARELAGGAARVPRVPGVYVFLGESEEVLYVGKSKNLSARLASYFTPSASRQRKVRSLCRFARAVRIERTGSEFAALLREIELVQKHSPPYNRRLRNPERYAYIGVDYRHPFPALIVTDDPWPQGQFLGPFPRRKRVDQAVRVIADAFGLRTCEPLPDGQACWRHQVRHCSAPCIGETTAGRYGRDLLQALLALGGRSRAALASLTAERDRLAAAERFEEAGRRQRSIEAIGRVSRLLFVTERPAEDVVVVQAGPEVGTIGLWAIVDGAVRGRIEAPREVLASSFAALWESARRKSFSRSPMVAQEELDARWVVFRWLRSREGQRWSVPVRGRAEAEVWKRVSELADAATADLFR